MSTDHPTVLFLCIHNAGRSQMALGWFRHFAGDRATAYSGGSEPAEGINPVAAQAMAEVGIDITAEHPTRWTDAQLDAADVVITMGCGDTCPYVPGTRYDDWPLDDPAGLDIEHVRPIRDEIRGRVEALLDDLRQSEVNPNQRGPDAPLVPLGGGPSDLERSPTARVPVDVVRDGHRLATSAKRTLPVSREVTSEAEDEANVGIILWR